MRNKLIAVAACGASALVTWAFTADIYESKMKSNQRLLGDIISRKDNEIEGYRQLLQNEWQQEGPMADAATDLIHSLVEPGEILYSDIVGGPAEEIRTEEVRPDFPPGETEEETRSRLQGLINEYNPDGDDVDQFVDMGVSLLDQRTPPAVISQQTFSMDEDTRHFDKNELTYYPRERILLDEDGEVIENVENVVGWRNLQRFGDESGHGDVVYIRNWQMETDFEVTRETETAPPAHVRYGLDKQTYDAKRVAGTIRFRGGDM